MKYALLILISWPLWASQPPCSEGEFLVKGHNVSPYKKNDGTKVSAASKKDYCKDKFPKAANWKKNFSNTPPKKWPVLTETFKAWNQAEKEKILELIGQQPEAFREMSDIFFYRGNSSTLPNKPRID